MPQNVPKTVYSLLSYTEWLVGATIGKQGQTIIDLLSLSSTYNRYNISNYAPTFKFPHWLNGCQGWPVIMQDDRHTVNPLCPQKVPSTFITTRKWSLRGLCFYKCLSVHGGGAPQCILVIADPPWEQTHPPMGADNPLGADTPAQCMLGDMAYKWAVRILLECIQDCSNLVFWIFPSTLCINTVSELHSGCTWAICSAICICNLQSWIRHW